MIKQVKYFPDSQKIFAWVIRQNISEPAIYDIKYTKRILSPCTHHINPTVKVPKACKVATIGLNRARYAIIT